MDTNLIEKTFLNLQSYFISYPKSGRTWIRVLYGMYLIKLLNIKIDQSNIETEIFDMSSVQFIKNKTVPPNLIQHWTHDVHKFTLFDHIIQNSENYQNTKIIVMRRNIKDTLISDYYHNKYRSEILKKLFSDISLEEYIRLPIFGIDWILHYYTKLESVLAHIPKHNILIINYENCITDINSEFKKILNFLNISINEECLSQSIKFSSFDNLHFLEKNGHFSGIQLKLVDPLEKNSFKVRCGKVNQYKTELSETCIKYIDGLIDETKCNLLIK